MNLVAFLLVAAAFVVGVIVALINRKEPVQSGFLLGIAVAILSLGVILQDVFIHWSRSVHQ